MKIKLPFPFPFTLDDYLLLAMQPAERQNDPATVAAILHVSDENAQTFVETFAQWRESREWDTRFQSPSDREIPRGCDLDNINVMQTLKLMSGRTRNYLIGASRRAGNHNQVWDYLTKIDWKEARRYCVHSHVSIELAKLQRILEAAQGTARFTPEVVAEGNAEARRFLEEIGLRRKVIKALFKDGGARATQRQHDNAVLTLRSRGMDEGLINRLLPQPDAYKTA